MSNILIFSDELSAAKELRTVADQVFSQDSIKLLCFKGTWNPEDYPLGETYVVSGCESLCDVGLVASCICEAARELDCTRVLLPSNRLGRELTGRLSQKMNAGALTGVTELSNDGSAIRAQRLALGGALIETDVINTEKAVYAIVPKNYLESQEVQGIISELDIKAKASRVTLLEVHPKEAGAVDIAQADVLAVAGCGVDTSQDIEQIEAFAATLNGAVGCTKPMATDRKLLSEDRIIGVSGKTVKPELALLFGVSGQVQFWAGIRDAGIIAVINSDENADSVRMADYAVICDWKEALDSFKETIA